MGLDIYLEYDRDVFSRRYYKQNAIKEIFTNKPTVINYPEKYDIMENEQSQLYPDHLCSQNYLRSSYNNSGYNSLANIYNCMSLYDIFEPILEDNCCTDCSKEKLQQCLENAKRNEEIWNSLNDKMFDIYPVYDRYLSGPNTVVLTRKTALEKFNSMYQDKVPDAYGISTFDKDRLIEMYDEPIEIFGVISNVVPEYAVGRPNIDCYKEHHVVFKRDITWYKQMAHIIVEFVEKALDLDYPYIVFWG